MIALGDRTYERGNAWGSETIPGPQMIADIHASSLEAAIAGAVVVLIVAFAYAAGAARGVRELRQRLTALGSRSVQTPW